MNADQVMDTIAQGARRVLEDTARETGADPNVVLQSEVFVSFGGVKPIGDPSNDELDGDDFDDDDEDDTFFEDDEDDDEDEDDE